MSPPRGRSQSPDADSNSLPEHGSQIAALCREHGDSDDDSPRHHRRIIALGDETARDYERHRERERRDRERRRSRRRGKKCLERYALGDKLGSGSFGTVYVAANKRTGQEFAAKVESVKCKHPMLKHEARVMKCLEGARGITTMHFIDVQGRFTMLIMDLLGPSVADLFMMCNRTFSLKTVSLIANQLLYRIEYIHSKGFIHRDIKPENMMFGRGDKANILYLVDFGLAKQYLDMKSQQHITYRENRRLIGTARFASINTHVGIEQSRRDDAEAIGYALMYFSAGRLPWQGLKGSSDSEVEHKILACKRVTNAQLEPGYPQAFSSYLRYCRSLRFEDRPNYSYLRRVLRMNLMPEGAFNNGLFDWMTPQPAKPPEAAEAQPAEEPQAKQEDKGKGKSMGCAFWKNSATDAATTGGAGETGAGTQTAGEEPSQAPPADEAAGLKKCLPGFLFRCSPRNGRPQGSQPATPPGAGSQAQAPAQQPGQAPAEATGATAAARNAHPASAQGRAGGADNAV